MNVLLDTHIWIWWINQDQQLPSKAAQLIGMADNVAVSSISCWEVRMLHQRQRIELSISIDSWFEQALQLADINCLPINCTIADKSANLPQHHRDPADRLIIATALEYNYNLLSIDGKFRLYEELADLLV
jgi:PIN domain nuclease of toxin-antitoxin system